MFQERKILDSRGKKLCFRSGKVWFQERNSFSEAETLNFSSGEVSRGGEVWFQERRSSIAREEKFFPCKLA